jgi:hypothetical protein
MNEALAQAYGYNVKTTLLDTTTSNATNTNSSTSYKDIPSPIQPHQTTTILYNKPHNIKWDPKDFVYTDGSHTCQRQKHIGSRGDKPANTHHHTY